jgi:hypothetical protein
MPFDEEDNEQPSNQSQRIGLKKVSSQQSIFDSMPKKPSPDEFEAKVKKVQEKTSRYKSLAADLATSFNKSMIDKTLPQNKNIFQQDFEKELMGKMVQLAIEINNDPNESEGMGSLTWITLLMKTCFTQRDKINRLEYAVAQLEKKTAEPIVTELVKKEITKALDNKKKSE